MLKGLHDEYNVQGSTCSSALDSSGFGGKIFRDLLSGIHPLRSVEFGGTGKKKLRILTDLKGLIEQSRMAFPRHGEWLRLRRQLLAYRLDDKLLKTDAVMGLVVAATEVVRSGGESTDHAVFDMFDERDLGIEVVWPRHKPGYDPNWSRDHPKEEEVGPAPDFDPEARADQMRTAARLRGASTSAGFGDW
jgi:hypothetical protein